eukprot:2100758-Pyramimonas_sp.AAC.1
MAVVTACVQRAQAAFDKFGARVALELERVTQKLQEAALTLGGGGEGAGPGVQGCGASQQGERGPADHRPERVAVDEHVGRKPLQPELGDQIRQC